MQPEQKEMGTSNANDQDTRAGRQRVQRIAPKVYAEHGLPNVAMLRGIILPSNEMQLSRALRAMLAASQVPCSRAPQR